MVLDAGVMSTLTFVLQTRAHHATIACTKETCPVGDPVYQYYPAMLINMIYTILFGDIPRLLSLPRNGIEILGRYDRAVYWRCT
jgi:hypothetical protein